MPPPHLHQMIYPPNSNCKLSHVSGCNDIGFDTANGSYRSKNSTFIWIRRNVYIFHFHNNFIFNKGKYFFHIKCSQQIDFDKPNPFDIQWIGHVLHLGNQLREKNSQNKVLNLNLKCRWFGFSMSSHLMGIAKIFSKQWNPRKMGDIGTVIDHILAISLPTFFYM